MTNANARYPDFYIVGAPRSGTTFMFEYLGRHPGVFVPERKEPNHFCTDLDSGSYLDSVSFVRDRQAYLDLFRGAGPGQLAGEGSTWYLFSRVAAENIQAVRPDARILIMLRDPVEMIYSLHGRRRFGGTETLEFAEALQAEPDRREGRRLPPRPRNVKALIYRDVARYHDQVKRYLDSFGASNVKVLVFDDFRAGPAAAFRSTLAFLGLEPMPLPQLDVVNAATRRRSERLHRLLLSPAVVHAGRAVIPRALRPRIGPVLDRFNAVPERRPPLDPDIRRRLVEELRDDVRRLSDLLGRDLEALWFGRDAHQAREA